MESNLLEEIEKNCLKFDSFEALRIKYSVKIFYYLFIKIKKDNNEVETVLELFIKKLIDIFSNMMLGSEESTLSKEGIREKIHKNPEIFKRVCSVLRNVNILKGKIKVLFFKFI